MSSIKAVLEKRGNHSDYVHAIALDGFFSVLFFVDLGF